MLDAHQTRHKGQNLGIKNQQGDQHGISTYQALAHVHDIFWDEENQSVHLARDRNRQLGYTRSVKPPLY